MSAFTPQSRPVSAPKRVASNTSLLTNRLPLHEESMYYVCLQLLSRLTRVPHMMPYIELAHANAEDAQLAQRAAIESPDFVESSLRDSGLSTHWISALKTFSTGILPRDVFHDPVTAVSNLFKLGAPFCLVFNAVSQDPKDHLEVITSDDTKICKMSIYKFLLACKQHLNIRDDELFPVTMPFSNDTSHLKRVIKSVEFVLNLDPTFDTIPIKDHLMINNETRSRVVKELVETERKFVQDLETLLTYRQDLLDSELFTSENVNLLFPNLLDIIDFQRRFLIGLESQVNSQPIDQRIGSLFVHAGVEGFKLYEAWALNQNAAMEFILKEAHRLSRGSQIIKDPYELQNFYLIKPIQRLTKYPLLLRQLIKESSPNASNYQELLQAELITKEVARGINEAQRKADNIKYFQQLKGNVVDWKGYSMHNVGDLLYFNVVSIKEILPDGYSNEKEVHCYLFEREIYFFKELSSRSKLLTRKTTNSGNNGPLQLVMSGMVHTSKITRSIMSDSSISFGNQPGHYLTLKWQGNKDAGGCIIKFKSEESLLQWDMAIKRLSSSVPPATSMNGNSTPPEELYPGSSHSSASFHSFRNSSNSNSAGRMRTASTSSFNTSMGSYPPLPESTTPKNRSVSGASLSSTTQKLKYRTSAASIMDEANQHHHLMNSMSNMTISKQSYQQQLQNSGSTTPTSSISLLEKTYIQLKFKNSSGSQESTEMSVSSQLNYNEVFQLLKKKIQSIEPGESLFKFKYQDEDGDLVRFSGDDDWQMAKEGAGPNGTLVIYL